MNEAQTRTLAIADALAERLSAEQLNEIREDLISRWTDADGLIYGDAPGGADVLLFALSDACAIAG